MIAISLDSSASLEPGANTLEFTLSSNNVSIDFPDNIQFKVNGIPVRHSIEEDDEDWLIEVELDLMGPQSVEVHFAGSDDDGLYQELFHLIVETSVYHRDYTRSVWAAYSHDLAAYFPQYSKARGDLNSVTRQLLNPLGLELDRIKLSIHKANKSLNFREAEVSDLDWLYQYRLGLGESFQTTQDASGDVYPVAPVLYGYRGVNRLRSLPKTSVSELVEAIPDRLVAEDRGTTHTQLSASIPFRELGALAPLKLSSPGWLFYEVHSVVGTLEINREVPVFRLILEGEGPGRIQQTETVRAAFPGFYKTSKRWHKIERVFSSGGLEDVQGEVIFHEAPPRNRVQIDTQIRRLDGRTVYWSLSKDGEGSYLDQIVRNETLILDTIKEQDTSEILSRHRLKDPFGEDVFVNDVSIDSKSFYMVGLGEESVYIWERREEFPERLALLNENAESPEQTFFLSLYDFPYEDDSEIKSTIRVELDTPQSSIEILTWRWSLHDSEGLSRHLDQNKLVTDEGPNWIYSETPITRYGIRDQDFSIEVAGTGTWTVTLHMLLADGTEQSYSKAIRIVGNNAVAEILLPHMEGYVQEDASIEVLPNGNYLVASQGKSWILRKQFDCCIIDYEDSSILFKDEFDKIEVTFNEQ